MDRRFDRGSKIDKDITLYIIVRIMSQLGQYFTENIMLKQMLFSFIKNNPKIILEPSIGRGDLIDYTRMQNPNIVFDMYEIDETIEMLDCIDKHKVVFGDFLSQKISTKYHNDWIAIIDLFRIILLNCAISESIIRIM